MAQHLARWALVVALLATAPGCPGPDATGPDSPEDEGPNGDIGGGSPPPSLRDRVLLFVRPTAIDNTTVFQGITLESDRYYLWRVVPSLDTASLLYEASSPSFAPRVPSWYSTDDRLFLRREVRPFEAGGSHELAEYSFDAFERGAVDIVVPEPNAAADGCSAVVGGAYYFRSTRTQDPFGSSGGGFFRHDIQSGSRQELIPFGDPLNCQSHLMSDGGGLYDVLLNPRDRPADILFFSRDLATGRPPSDQALVALGEPAPEQYAPHSYRFAVDGGYWYLVRRRTGGGSELWRHRFLPSAEAQPTLLLEGDVGFPVHWLDVDDGHVLLAGTNGRILLYDAATGRQDALDLGVEITSIQQMFVGG